MYWNTVQGDPACSPYFVDAQKGASPLCVFVIAPAGAASLYAFGSKVSVFVCRTRGSGLLRWSAAFLSSLRSKNESESGVGRREK